MQWYLEGGELSEEGNVKIELNEGGTYLFLNKLHRKDSGEVKIKLKNEFGTSEALTQLIVKGVYIHLSARTVLNTRIQMFIQCVQH